jgi:hypothetical protein
MNVPVNLDAVHIVIPETNPRLAKVITQVRDPGYGDNEWHDLVYEVMNNSDAKLTTKALHEHQRIIIEVI